MDDGHVAQVTLARPLTDGGERAAGPGSPRDRVLLGLVGILALAAVLLPRVPGSVGDRATLAVLASTSLVVESLPFLLAGAALALFLQRIPPERFTMLTERHPRLAVALAPLSGAVLPLCDCGLVPIARRLHGGGVRSAAVNGFVAGAPLTNPIVILSTLVAFPGRPGMVVGRVAVGVGVAMLVAGLGPRPRDVAGPGHVHDHCEERPGPLGGLLDELVRTGPTLVVGALAAGTIKAFVPTDAPAALAAQPLLGAAALAALAFVMAICSQADAFVAASLPVGPLPQLAFMTMGPALDVRLAALYRREFGTRWVLGYAAVVVPAVLVLATVWVTWGPT